ncbi:MAG TPA: alpha/beta fold hydrolase [Gaiellaceae bacterium]|nr:alpha/beta fold hydrolase [Gaiellaceae bacterium]
MVPDALEQAWTSELERQGPITSVGEPLTEAAPPAGTTVKVPVSCARGGFTLLATVTDTGQLLALQLASPEAAQPLAAWQPPSYADPARFAEYEITLETGPRSVPGTLSLPDEPIRAAVVLLAGSGSLDRDETIGRNKPLKDIAWGLASQGFAVVRFDKVTYTHAHDLKNAQNFTLTDEYLPQAAAAIELLIRHPATATAPVFLLGHSLGGTVAPRIAAEQPSVAGLILLAAGAHPLHWTIVRQTRYLANLNPQTQTAAKPIIESLTEKAKRVDSTSLSPTTPADELPLGAPASYWLDLRNYDPAQLAATLDRPILILQGGRDYQATVDDDLTRWQTALAGREDVRIRVYPSLNHLFTPGQGPSSPAEYEPEQHVDQTVISDITDWLDTTDNH